MSKKLSSNQWFKKLMNYQGSLVSFEYGRILNSLFLLRHLNGRFEKQREYLITEGREDDLEDSDSYFEKNVTYLPKEARWSEILQQSQESNLGVCLDKAFELIQQEDNRLIGVIKRYCFTQSGLKQGSLRTIMDDIERIYEEADSEEEFINNFQELLNEFAQIIGKQEKENKHTQLTASKLLVTLLEIEHKPARIYDPCFGTGSLLLEASKYIKKTYKDMDETEFESLFSFYGQERYWEMHSLAKINFAINGIEPFFGEPACTFNREQHVGKKMDYIVASIPSNQSDWRDEEGLIDDVRWEGYGIPPVKSANYAWILHIINKLSSHGIATVLIPQRALHGGGDEKRIRQRIIENGLIEAVILLPKRLVYNDDIQLSILVINKNKAKKTIIVGDQAKTCRNRTQEVLFIDARKGVGVRVSGDLQLSLKDIEKIVKTLQDWRYEFSIQEINENEKISYKSVTLEEIKAADFSLFQDQYVSDNSNKELEQVLEWEVRRKEIEENLLILFKKEEEKRENVLKLFTKKS
ncbi:hypothetical protein DNK47_02905 [Mycoplasma wenyonii]|uniref:site-specific DNA-methyltransferase (adenine-specific) n=1 Tax=Mycoplasma wenyonii TaxID=65123 RepID=A0A328PR80_9MOLU|nr:N-6 DNA methylase [Mycoplasma wenyonii]RAO94837.1 hypothetical protein DNK47_02905 [Mycoplasma wenyonii]